MKQVLREKNPGHFQLHGDNYGYCILMLNFEILFFFLRLLELQPLLHTLMVNLKCSLALTDSS